MKSDSCETRPSSTGSRAGAFRSGTGLSSKHLLVKEKQAKSQGRPLLLLKSNAPRCDLSTIFQRKTLRHTIHLKKESWHYVLIIRKKPFC